MLRQREYLIEKINNLLNGCSTDLLIAIYAAVKNLIGRSNK